jgi:mannose-6-phosphate isomerase-like protein (cupin superfamily)
MQTTTTTNPASHADAADPRAVVVRPAGQGEAIWFLDTLATVKASAADGARFGLLEKLLPAGSMTPYHRHLDDDESFYLIEGAMTIFLEGERVLDLGPGAFLRIPHGIAHGFRTKTLVRMLVFSDPAGFPAFVREVGMPAPRRELPPAAQPDVPRLAAIAEKHRIALLGPLPE